MKKEHDIELLLQEAPTLMNKKAYDQLESKCKDILEQDPNQIEAASLLFQALLAQEKYDEQIAVAFHYYQLTQDDEALAMTWEHFYFKDLLDESIQFCEQILTQYPNYSRAWLWKGLSYNKQGYFEKGFKCWNNIDMDDPRYLDVLNNSGLVYDEIGLKREAKKYYLNVIHSNLDNDRAKAFAYVNAANLLKASNMEDAISWYKDALSFSEYLDFDFSAPYYHLGEIYFSLKNYLSAAFNYEKYLEMDIQNMEVRLQLAKCYQLLNNRQRMNEVIANGIEIGKKYHLDSAALEHLL